MKTPTHFDPEAMRQRIDDEIRRQRRSQTDVAKSAGLGHGYLTNLLQRGQMPAVDKLHMLCNELGISITWAMYGIESPPDFERVIELMSKNPEKFEAMLTLLE